MTAVVNTIVLPGDVVQPSIVSEVSGKAVCGPGLKVFGDDIVVTKPGILRFREPNFYWVDSHQKRYIPVRGDQVIGIVTNKVGDVFVVDIGCNETASLSYLSFEGATKRNRPDVKIGDLVYARLLSAGKDIEPELVCIDGQGRSSGMGVIRHGEGEGKGFMFRTSLHLVRKALSKECKLLSSLGNAIPYEAAIGMNGRIWVRGRSIKDTIAVMNVMLLAEHMTNDEIKVMVKKVADGLAGF